MPAERTPDATTDAATDAVTPGAIAPRGAVADPLSAVRRCAAEDAARVLADLGSDAAGLSAAQAAER
ncbi:MAG: hypothetical protein JST25_04905, partial [Actinobacteria bacterium]|nr:hypothetical protein [Actinomycetota bacterium]